jgi:coenzyme F420-reducing hydrogenase delta subunit
MEPQFKLVVLACRQALTEPENLGRALSQAGLQARVALEPCSSKIEAYQLLRILATDADLVWVVGCPEPLCQFLEGSTRLGRRLAYAQKYLAEIPLEPERLGLSRITPGDREALKTVAAEIAAQASSLTPLPCH